MPFTTLSSLLRNGQDEINVFNISGRLKNKQLESDLHIKPTDTHQFLNLTSCHPYHYNKGITHSQALRYSKISSGNNRFDQRCNDLDKWLMKRSCSARMVKTQILKARDKSRYRLLEQGDTIISESKLAFNITYYPAFENVRRILEELQILLALDKK